MESVPIHFIDEAVEVIFARPPLLEKKPDCPNGFIWRGETFHIVELLSAWVDNERRGRMARNMAPEHAARASVRGSWGVGRFFFRVAVAGGRIFDLYYDRAPKDSAHRKGAWFIKAEREAAGPKP